MNRRIYLISDTHFGHENIIRYCNRPFASVEEMNEVMIENWNKTVRPQDIVYHLGDVYFGERGRDCLRHLMGRKRLLLGNHDNGKDRVLHAVFQKIGMWRMFPEYDCVLTHVPVHIGEHAEERQEKWHWNIHGHIHDQQAPTKFHINVSVEQIAYTPVDIEHLAHIMRG